MCNFQHVLISIECGRIGNAADTAWLSAGHVIAALWRRQPDRQLQRLADRHGLHLRRIDLTGFYPVSDAARDLERANCLLTVSTLQIVPPDKPARFPGRTINFHPALLPECKEAVPQLARLVDGLANHHEAMTSHLLTHWIDADDLVGQRPVPCRPQDRWQYSEYRLACAAVDLAVIDFAEYLGGRRKPVPPQPGGYHRETDNDEFCIDATKTVAQLQALIRALRSALIRCTQKENLPRRPYRCIDRFLAGLGPPTRSSTRVRFPSIELDLRDGRVRLGRHARIARLRERIDRWRCTQSAQRISTAARR